MENNQKIPATVRVLTLNSERTLRRCLESLKDFGEILIFDGNSTDQTLAIAREYGARIERQHPNSNAPNQIIRDWPELVNRATQAAIYDWVLYIDSDEAASPELVQEIREIASSPKIEHYLYLVPNKIIYKNRIIKYSLPYPGYQQRFINKRSGARYEGSSHYHLVYDKNKYSIGKLKNPWYVFVDDDDTDIKLHMLTLDAIRDKDQSWPEFFYWSIYKKISGIIKLLIRTAWLYIRHGFKETLPPRIESMRIKYKAVLFWYLMKQRFIGPLKLDTAPKEYMPQDNK